MTSPKPGIRNKSGCMSLLYDYAWYLPEKDQVVRGVAISIESIPVYIDSCASCQAANSRVDPAYRSCIFIEKTLFT